MAPKKSGNSAKDPKEARREAERANKQQREQEMRETAARELAAQLAKGPGPPPTWIVDSAAKVRDSQCKTELRRMAARGIEERMEEAKSFVSYYGGALSCAIIGDEDEDVRCACCDALGALGEIGLPYVDALTSSILNDKCAAVRSSAARSLGLVCRSPQKKAAQELCDYVFAVPDERGNPPEVDGEVLERILSCCSNANRKSLTSLKTLINAQEPQKDPASGQAVEASEEERTHAASKFCRSILKDCESEVIETAILLFKVRLVEALPLLQTYCNSFLYKSDRLKYSKALDTLLPVAMNDPDGDVRQEATTALCELNCSTEPMFKALAETLETDTSSVKRLRAAQTFASFIRVSDHMAVETLHSKGHAIATAAMHDANPGVRAAAATALGASLTEAGPYVDDLIASLKTGEPAERREAVRALGAIGEASLPYVPTFFAVVLEDDDFSVRYWSAEALGRIGEPAVPYIYALAAVALYDLDETMQARSNEALGAVGDVAGQIVDEFSINEDEEEQARQERATKVLDELNIPHQGLVLVKEQVAAAQKAAPKKKKGDKKKKQNDEDQVKKVCVNRNFKCDVGEFLRKLNAGDDEEGSPEGEGDAVGTSPELSQVMGASQSLPTSPASPKRKQTSTNTKP